MNNNVSGITYHAKNTAHKEWYDIASGGRKVGYIYRPHDDVFYRVAVSEPLILESYLSLEQAKGCVAEKFGEDDWAEVIS